MHDAGQMILDAMRAQTAPDSGWTMPVLRRMTGLSVGAFAGALSALRKQGKVHPFELALAPAMWPVEPAAESAPSIVEAVEQEVVQSAANRATARLVKQTGYLPSSAGARLQELALKGAPEAAAGILRERWEDTWHALCSHARRTQQRPVTAMIALLDAALAQHIEQERAA